MSQTKRKETTNVCVTTATTCCFPQSIPVKYRPELTNAVKCENASCVFQNMNDTAEHFHHPYKPYNESLENKIQYTILEHVGNTPLVKVNSIAKKANLKCDLLAKCEFFNAGGSVKDRIGKRMVEDAMATGRIKPGDTLIEPTSGNTGIGLALAAAIYGFRMIITLPEKMSQEKVDVLKALGAEIIRTPTEAAWDSPESHIGVAKKLNGEIPNSHILDQYKNLSNPLAHYDQTAEEILDACDGKVDMVVIGAGTGGTIAGIGQKMKEKCPSCIIVGVDPVGSILAQPESLNDAHRLEGYEIEGIGYDFIPQVLNRKVVDKWIKMNDKDSFRMSRRLIREEGFLCGGSSGTAMAAALIAAKDLKAGQKCVVVLSDSTRNYMTKFLCDSWMIDHGYVEQEKPTEIKSWWTKKMVMDLQIRAPYAITPDVTCKEAVALLKTHSFGILPVVDAVSNTVVGAISEGNLTAYLMPGRILPSDPIKKAMFKSFKKVTNATTLGELSRIFDTEYFALVVTEQRSFRPGGVTLTKELVTGVITRIDLLSFITAGTMKMNDDNAVYNP